VIWLLVVLVCADCRCTNVGAVIAAEIVFFTCIVLQYCIIGICFSALITVGLASGRAHGQITLGVSTDFLGDLGDNG